MRVFVFSLPLPPREAGKNCHAGWWERHPVLRAYKTELVYRLRSLRGAGAIPKAFSTPIRIDFDFMLFDAPALRVLDHATGQRRRIFYIPRDLDNARGCAWPVQDMLKSEGFIADDSAAYVEIGQTRLHRKDHGDLTCLLVTVTELAAETHTATSPNSAAWQAPRASPSTSSTAASETKRLPGSGTR